MLGGTLYPEPFNAFFSAAAICFLVVFLLYTESMPLALPLITEAPLSFFFGAVAFFLK
jgi:hypothetical protein